MEQREIKIKLVNFKKLFLIKLYLIIKGDYIKLVLQSSYLNGDDERIPLSGPNKEKHFQDIKVTG